MEYDNHVRKYLIDVVRSNRKMVYYSTLVNECNLNLDLSSEGDRAKLSKLLGDITTYELSKGRPLLSAAAYYKETNDHGNGFYQICEKLGLGKAAKLKAEHFGFTEADRCSDYWLQNDHYNIFYDENLTSTTLKDPGYFNMEELQFFGEWAGAVYDPADPAHVEMKERLLKTVWDKTIALGVDIHRQLVGFDIKKGRYWHQPGWDTNTTPSRQVAIVKPYTWVRLFKDGDRHKDIFFTVGVEPDSDAFIYKLDHYFEKDGYLSPEQKELFVSLLPSDLKWNEIPFAELITLSQEQIVDRMLRFINNSVSVYDRIMDAVWNNRVTDVLPADSLLLRNPPTGIAELPNFNPTFEGVTVDYAAQHIENTKLGSAGEQLVIKHEKELLKDYPHLAEQVDKVEDGNGFDILSFHPNGDKKYIEVKTTKGGETTPFDLSINELLFMRLNLNTYFIYRLYNYNEKKRTALFYILDGEVENKILTQPTQFRVFKKAH